jgi:hypothetical protein
MSNYTTIQFYRKATLPIELVEDVRAIGFSNTLFNHAIHLLYKLSVNPTKGDRTILESFQPLTTSFLKAVLGDRYINVVRPLREMGVIECDDIFYRGKGYYYRINPDYFNNMGRMETVTFKYKGKKLLSDYRSQKELLSQFKEDFSERKIPFIKLYKKVEQITNELSLDDLKINLEARYEGRKAVAIFENNPQVLEMEENERGKIKFINRGYGNTTKHLTFDSLVYLSHEMSLDVVNDGGKIYLCDSYDYLESKRRYIKLSYLNAIENLKDEQTLYASRNKTNNRLDTNFTGLASDLYEIILVENNMVEIDAVNSQPALLAYQLEQSNVNDEGFINDAYSGQLYEKLSDSMVDCSRDMAKIATFEVLFSSERLNSRNKRFFKELYPVTWQYTVDYKKRHGKNQLAISLQKLEAEIFIDKIYYILISSGILCFTKHDSIACKKEDYDIVIQVVKEVFEQVGFKGSLKTSKGEELAA